MPFGKHLLAAAVEGEICIIKGKDIKIPSNPVPVFITFFSNAAKKRGNGDVNHVFYFANTDIRKCLTYD